MRNIVEEGAVITRYSSPLNFPLSSLAKTDHVVRSRAGTICHYNPPINFRVILLATLRHVV